MANHRWMWRTIFPNLNGYLWDFRNGVKAFWMLRAGVWRFRPWDYYGLLYIMEIALKIMAESNQRHIPYVGADKDLRHMKVAAELCHRLRTEPYPEMHGEVHDKQWAQRWSFSEKNDAEYLGKMLRGIKGWWN